MASIEKSLARIEKGQEEGQALMKVYFKKVMRAIDSSKPNVNTTGSKALEYHSSVLEQHFSNLPCNTVEEVVALNTALSEDNLSISMV